MMGRAIIYTVLTMLAAFAVPGIAPGQDNVEAMAEPPALVENPPSRYVVVKGDTLWDISTRFLRDPWRWPDIWGLNRDQIKNPHWIYPGDVIILDFSGRTPRLRFEGDADWQLVISRLSPKVRTSPLGSAAVPSIPAARIKAFLSKALIVGEHELDGAPRIIAGQDGRVVLGPGDIAFARGLSEPINNRYYAVRDGRTFVDPDTKEILGHEAIYLADVRVNEVADVSTLYISRAVREINPGDRLLAATDTPSLPYMPHPPAANIHGKVIAAAEESVSEIGPLTVVILNRGSREGLEVGNVLAVSRAGDMLISARAKDPEQQVRLPDERYGVVFVFKVFERLSYALVMNTTRPVKVNDVVLTP